MSLLIILKLVGFATGTALFFYIAWLLWRRKTRSSGTGLNLLDSETAFIMLAICLGTWFAGNLLGSLQLILGLGRQTGWLRVWDAITVIGIALTPSVMLHSHTVFWSRVNEYQWMSRAGVKRLVIALYIPMLVLPYTVYRVTTGDYKPYLPKLKPLLLPYSIWFLLALWSCAIIDWRMKDRLYAWASRERKFLKSLAGMLFALGAFEFVVVGLRRSALNDPLWVAYILLSLLPPIAVAYYIYRYHPFQLVIRDSLVYSAFAVIFIVVYTYGVRYVVEFLVARYEAPGALVEAILILGMIALARPLVRLMDRTVQRLFTREIGLYRDVVRQVSAGAAGFADLDSLVRYLEDTIQRELDLTAVRIIPADAAPSEGPARKLLERMAEPGVEVIDSDENLMQLEGTAAYPLKRENRLIGVMIVAGERRTMTTEKHAVLEVLSGQAAIEIDSCRLVEEKVRLERELAARERLAVLGQMAATVAHEVKNPLSSIKSIAQVMREDDDIRDYNGDLDLIIGEIDRLNRTVSQLLAFSRPGADNRAEVMRAVSLRDIVDSTVALVSGDAAERKVRINVEAVHDTMLTGAQGAALREALSNLVLNAVQASEPEGVVTVNAMLSSSPDPRTEGALLAISVTDEGPGIPPESQARVYEPFFTTKPRGTGLGLAIVRRRAAEIGCSVELTSPVSGGRGTRFELAVPLEAHRVAPREAGVTLA